MTSKCAAIIMLNSILYVLNGNGKLGRHSNSNQGSFENCRKRRAEHNKNHGLKKNNNKPKKKIYIYI